MTYRLFLYVLFFVLKTCVFSLKSIDFSSQCTVSYSFIYLVFYVKKMMYTTRVITRILLIKYFLNENILKTFMVKCKFITSKSYHCFKTMKFPYDVRHVSIMCIVCIEQEPIFYYSIVNLLQFLRKSIQNHKIFFVSKKKQSNLRLNCH